MLNKAENWISAEVQYITTLEGLERQDAIQALFTHATGLEDFALAEFKSLMVKIGVKGLSFSEMLKAAQSQKEGAEGEAIMPEVLSESVPILSLLPCLNVDTPDIFFQRQGIGSKEYKDSALIFVGVR